MVVGNAKIEVHNPAISDQISPIAPSDAHTLCLMFAVSPSDTPTRPKILLTWDCKTAIDSLKDCNCISIFPTRAIISESVATISFIRFLSSDTLALIIPSSSIRKAFILASTCESIVDDNSPTFASASFASLWASAAIDFTVPIRLNASDKPFPMLRARDSTASMRAPNTVKVARLARIATICVAIPANFANALATDAVA